MLITYRDDEGAPANPDGFHRHGLTEWKDLEAGAAYALAHGAEGLILVGYSMGGAIVTSFLYESSLREKVRGVILDSPMLDFSATVDHGAGQREGRGLNHYGPLRSGRFPWAYEVCNICMPSTRNTEPNPHIARLSKDDNNVRRI